MTNRKLTVRTAAIATGAVVMLAVAFSVLGSNGASAVTGSIFVANEWSTITNESPAPGGFISGSDVYSTYAEPGRLIETDSDLVRITVIDPDFDVLAVHTVDDSANITVPTTGGGDGNDTITPATLGSLAIIELTGLGGVLIAGTLADVQANTSIKAGAAELNVDNGGTGLKIVAFFAGDSVNSPWIQVQVHVPGPHTITEIEYQTSAVDSLTAVVTSDLEVGGITVELEESGVSSGRFVGFVRLVPSSGISSSGAPAVSDGVPEPGAAGSIRTGVGPVVASYSDDAVLRTSSVLVDVSPPASVATGPTPGSSTQNSRPTFSGTIADTGSGLDVSSITVAYDDANDFANVQDVVNTATGFFVGTSVPLPISTAGALDGDPDFSFSQSPSSDIPGGGTITTPDHIVDWVIKASDLAGNIGLTDADPVTSGVQLPTVKIDKVIPAFSTTQSEHRTGIAWSVSPPGEVVARNSIRVVFNDSVANVQPSDFTVTLDSGAIVVPVGVTVLNNPTIPSGFVNRGLVYLELADDLASDETPTVELQNAISDLAGNSTSVGSVSVTDGLGPLLTLTTSGGSGTGVGDQGPGGLTNSQMTLTITSDEALAAAPTVEVFTLASGFPELTPTALGQGANTWAATYVHPGILPDGMRAVKVKAVDVSANETTLGDNFTRVFSVDRSVPIPVISVGPVRGSAEVLSAKPTITIDFAGTGEASSITLPPILLNGAPITDTFTPSFNNRIFLTTVTTDLTDGDHTLFIPGGTVVDAAGNTLSVPVQFDFTVNAASFVGFELSPTPLPVRSDEAAVITVSVDDLGPITPDEIQINLAHDDAMFFMQNPVCTGPFAGGTASAVVRDSDDLGSSFTCTLGSGAVGTTGPVATFELVRLSAGNPTLSLRLDGPAPTLVLTGSLVIAVPDVAPTVDILPGTRITGEITIQGVSDPVAFAALEPELTLQNIAGGSPTVLTPDTDGTFSFEGVFDGTYDLTIEAEGSLGRILSEFIISGSDLSLSPVELRGGRADSGDLIDGADVSAVLSSFGFGPSDLDGQKTVDTGLVVDFDGDGFVSAFDISIAISNLGESRHQVWTDPSAVHPAP